MTLCVRYEQGSVSDVSKYESLARRALNAPVQFGQNVNYRIPGTGKFVSVVAGTPGRAVNTMRNECRPLYCEVYES